MIEPGIFDLAHKAGIFVTDVNGDGNIDKKDLNEMVAAKKVASATTTK